MGMRLISAIVNGALQSADFNVASTELRSIDSKHVLSVVDDRKVYRITIERVDPVQEFFTRPFSVDPPSLTGQDEHGNALELVNGEFHIVAGVPVS